MRRLATIGTTLFLALTVLSLIGSARDNDKDRSKNAATDTTSIIRRIMLVNSSGVTGVDQQVPFFPVPRILNLSDTTTADTILTSSVVWTIEPLWRITKTHESRVDVVGPVSITCITMAPYHRPGLQYRISYRMGIRIDEGRTESVLIGTTRGNPLYTTRLPGWTFGAPQAFDIQVPSGRHSVYIKADKGPFDFLYCMFQANRPPPEDVAPEEPSE